MKYTVVVTAMTSNESLEITAKSRTESFNNWDAACRHYCTCCEDFYLYNAEYAVAEMNLTAGGVGYDYRVEIICE